MISFDLVFGCQAYLSCDHHFVVGKVIKVFFIKNKEHPQHWVSQKPFVVAEIAPTTGLSTRTKSVESNLLNCLSLLVPGLIPLTPSQRPEMWDRADNQY